MIRITYARITRWYDQGYSPHLPVNTKIRDQNAPFLFFGLSTYSPDCFYLWNRIILITIVLDIYTCLLVSFKRAGLNHLCTILVFCWVTRCRDLFNRAYLQGILSALAFYCFLPFLDDYEPFKALRCLFRLLMRVVHEASWVDQIVP